MALSTLWDPSPDDSRCQAEGCQAEEPAAPSPPCLPLCREAWRPCPSMSSEGQGRRPVLWACMLRFWPGLCPPLCAPFHFFIKPPIIHLWWSWDQGGKGGSSSRGKPVRPFLGSLGWELKTMWSRQEHRHLVGAECVGRKHRDWKGPEPGLLRPVMLPMEGWGGGPGPVSTIFPHQEGCVERALRREVGGRASRVKPSKLWPARQGWESVWEKEGERSRKGPGPGCQITTAVIT